MRITTEAQLTKAIRQFMDKKGHDAGLFAIANAIHTEGMSLVYKPLSGKLMRMGNRLYMDAEKIGNILCDDLLENWGANKGEVKRKRVKKS